MPDNGTIAYVAAGACVVASIAIVVEALRAYPRLPARMPLHFDLVGKADGYGPKVAFLAV